jgi:hypothetical protein
MLHTGRSITNAFIHIEKCCSTTLQSSLLGENTTAVDFFDGLALLMGHGRWALPSKQPIPHTHIYIGTDLADANMLHTSKLHYAKLCAKILYASSQQIRIGPWVTTKHICYIIALK